MACRSALDWRCAAPILMTALALLPIMVGGNRPGQEIEDPMAVVILEVLDTSTVLILFVMPGSICGL